MSLRPKGVLLIATGVKYLAHAARCIHSIRSRSNIPITLCTSESTDLPADVVSITATNNGFRDKIQHLVNTPYERTLFLDADTLVLRKDAVEVLELLDRFEMAIAHAPQYESAGSQLIQVPQCFPEFNTGVIAYRKSETVWDILFKWRDLFERHLRSDLGPALHDQPALREVLFKTPILLATLPKEYNFRCSPFCSIRRATDVRILHNRRLQPAVLTQDGRIDLSVLRNWRKYPGTI